jgi:hypothetical protein
VLAYMWLRVARARAIRGALVWTTEKDDQSFAL